MKTKMEVTAWLPWSTPPVRNGWYERLVSSLETGEALVVRCWWDCVNRAWCHGDEVAFYNFASWRGVRRWVLTRSQLDSEPEYLHRVDLGAAELWGVSLLPSIGFDSEAEAQDFAAKLPMTRDAVAVLP